MVLVKDDVESLEDDVESLEDELVEESSNQWGSLAVFLHQVFAYVKRN
jgi:hypothetical protein